MTPEQLLHQLRRAVGKNIEFLVDEKHALELIRKFALGTRVGILKIEGVELNPGYWMNEASGRLRPAVEAYLRNEPLNVMQIAAIRAYLRQWIAGPWDQNPHANEADRQEIYRLRRDVDGLVDRDAIDKWIVDAQELGLDPL